MFEKCIVFGCTNKKNQGEFIGDICAPCFKTLTKGDIAQQSTNFVHILAQENERLRNIVEKMNVMERVWLIECKHSGYPEWWTGSWGEGSPGNGWTPDPLKAVRFSRKEDADAVIHGTLQSDSVIATEHQWDV